MRRSCPGSGSLLILMAFVSLFAAVPVQSDSSWRWPLTGGFTLEQGLSAPGWVFRVTPANPMESEMRPVAEGALEYFAPGREEEILRTSLVPRPSELALFSHGNGFVSAYFSPRLADALRTGASEPIADSRAIHDLWMEFAIWDVRRRSRVNPRSLLTLPEAPLTTEIPALQFVQRGAPVPPAGISAGTVSIHLDGSRLNPFRLPWELRIIHNGEIRSSRRFVFSEDFPDADDVLYEFEAPLGWNTILLQALRFDRTVAERTVRFRAIAPPASGP